MNAVGQYGPSGHRVIGCVTAVHRGGSAHVWGLTPEESVRTALDTREKPENATHTHAKVLFVVFNCMVTFAQKCKMSSSQKLQTVFISCLTKELFLKGIEIVIKLIRAGEWSCWGDFSPCSVTCGRGKMMRTRRCEAPLPGREFTQTCEGTDREEKHCKMPPCNREFKSLHLNGSSNKINGNEPINHHHHQSNMASL